MTDQPGRDEISFLEGYIADDLISHFTTYDPSFRVGDRTFRLAFLEEVSDEIADDDMVVMIDPATGELFEVEVEVFVRKLHRPDPEPAEAAEPVDPNQLPLPFNQETEDEIDAAEREIAAITDDRMREMALAELNKRYGPYLTARLNDEENP